MSKHWNLEHSIRVRKGDLFKLIICDCGYLGEQKKKLGLILEAISSLFIMDFVKTHEKLKKVYCIFDPDSDHYTFKKKLPNLTSDALSETEENCRLETLENGFIELLEHANFKRFTMDTVDSWINKTESFWGLKVEIKQTDFDRLVMYYRGETFISRKVRKWWKPWIRTTTQVSALSRLAILVKMKRKKVGQDFFNAKQVFLKLYKDIPKTEITMMFPGAKVRLTPLDQSMIGYPILTGMGFIVYNILSVFMKVGFVAILGLTTWPLAIAFGGYGYRSYYTYVSKRQNYDLQMTKNLCFQNLDSNAGVITCLLDEAEEQESREAMLGYYCLLKYAPSEGWTSHQLDDYVELFFSEHFEKKIDFEIDDCLDKLRHLGLIEEYNGLVKAICLDDAFQKLQLKWSARFLEQNAFGSDL